MNKFKSMKLYMQILIVALVTLFLLFIISVFSYSQTSDTFRQKNEQYTQEIISQLKQTIYSNYNALSKITQFIAFDVDVQKFLMENKEPAKFQYYQRVFSNLVNLQGLNSEILDIVIFNQKGERYGINGEQKFDIPLQLGETNIGVSHLLQYDEENKAIPYLVIGKKIFSTDAYVQVNDSIGSVYLVLSDSAFVSTSQSTYQKSNSKIYLFDSAMHPFWSNSTNNAKDEIAALSPALPFDENGMLPMDEKNIHVEHLTDIPISIVSVLESEDFINGIKKVQFTSYTLFLCVFVFVAALWSLQIRAVVKPLKQLVTFISTIKTGSISELKTRINLTGYREISIVSTEFNEMLDTINVLTRQLVQTTSNLYEAEIDKREAELAHLRSQINPHFLYNTLESIKGIAAQHGITDISNITKSLATIFKYSIKGDNFVPLKNELKIGKSYLEIQLFRFSDRFDVAYDIDKKCEGYYVPKMILQPIIENAIVHGIESHNGFCHLTISAKEEKDLIITVSDNGNGIEGEKLEEIKQALSFPKDTIHGEHGIGVHNINNRIQLIYGKEYGVHIESMMGEGTSVTLNLPIDRR